MITQYKPPIKGKSVSQKTPVKKPTVKKTQSFLTKQNLQWLGIFLIFLAFLSFLFMILSNRRNSKVIYKSKPLVVENYDVEDVGEDDDLFEKLDFQKVHTQYQASYLELIQKINSMKPLEDSPDGVIRIDGKKDVLIFENYKTAQENYTKILKKVEEHEKNFKKACYRKMQGLVQAVLGYDKIAGKRVTKFDYEKLIEAGLLAETPICPRGGEYSIVYRNGRRLFNCSVHGVLKN